MLWKKNMVCDNIKFTDSTSRIIIKTISANNSAYSLFFTSDQNIYHSFWEISEIKINIFSNVDTNKLGNMLLYSCGGEGNDEIS